MLKSLGHLNNVIVILSEICEFVLNFRNYIIHFWVSSEFHSFLKEAATTAKKGCKQAFSTQLHTDLASHNGQQLFANISTLAFKPRKPNGHAKIRGLQQPKKTHIYLTFSKCSPKRRTCCLVTVTQSYIFFFCSPHFHKGLLRCIADF